MAQGDVYIFFFCSTNNFYNIILKQYEKNQAEDEYDFSLNYIKSINQLNNNLFLHSLKVEVEKGESTFKIVFQEGQTRVNVILLFTNQRSQLTHTVIDHH